MAKTAIPAALFVALTPAAAFGATRAWVAPLARAYDLGLVLWLLLFVAALFLVLRRSDATDRLLATALVLCGAALRATLAAQPANYYLPVAPQGLLGETFAGSYPVVSDGLLRLLAVLGGGDGAYFLVQTALGCVPGPTLFLAARTAGARRSRALLFAGLTAALPLLVWLSRSDAPQVLVLTLASGAVLGMTSRLRVLSTALAGLSLVLAFGIRLELIPGLLALPLLADGLRAPRRGTSRRPFVVAGIALVVAALAFGPALWTRAAQLGGGMQADASPAANLASLLAGQTPGMPGWLSWTIVAPLAVVGLAGLARAGYRHGTWQAALGLTLASAPAWFFGIGVDDLIRGRYLALAVLFSALLLVRGVEHLTAVTRGRAPWLAGALVALGAMIVGSLTLPSGTEPWQAEYRFLAEAVDEMPADCRVDFATGPQEDTGQGVGILPLGLPHALLALRRPDVHWRALSAAPAIGDEEGCRYIYAGLGATGASGLPTRAAEREMQLGAWTDPDGAPRLLRLWRTR